MLNFKYKFLYFGKIKPRRWKVMTNKELLYVEDALGHEEFMKKCSNFTANQIKDLSLGTYIKQLEEKHSQMFEKFLNLL